MKHDWNSLKMDLETSLHFYPQLLEQYQSQNTLDKYVFTELINDVMIEANPCLKWSCFIVMLEQGDKQERWQRSASWNATRSALSLFLKYLKELCGNLLNPPCQKKSEEAILPPH